METGTGMMLGISVVISILAAILGIIATIGGLRSFREGEIQSELFTSNLVWPYGRILGANITTTVFATILGFLFALPALALIGVLGGSVEAVAGASGPVLALTALAGIMGLGAFFYVTVVLLIAQPLVAIDNRRLFQALDESVQRTKGHRSSIFVALLGIAIAYLGLYAVFAAIGTLGPDFIAAIGVLLVSPVLTSATLSLLNYLTEELPKA